MPLGDFLYTQTNRMMSDRPSREPPSDVRTVSRQIQEVLGARPEAPVGRIEDILSARFQPTFDDVGDAANATLFGGRPVSGQQIADTRMGNAMERLTALRKLQASSGPGGGATGELIQRYMDSTGASFPQALQAVQTGFRRDALINEAGELAPMAGALRTRAAIKQAEADAANQSDLYYTPKQKLEEQRNEQFQEFLANQYGVASTKNKQAIDLIKSIKNKTGDGLTEDVKAIVGYKNPFSGAIPFTDDPLMPGLPKVWSGSKAASGRAKVRQAQGQVFLEAYESLRGAGALTNVEGQKGEQAKARLDAAQDEASFLQAINELEDVLVSAQDRLDARKQEAEAYLGGGVYRPNSPGMDLPTGGNRPFVEDVGLENVSDDELLRLLNGG